MKRLLFCFLLLCGLVAGCGPVEGKVDLPGDRHLALTFPSGWKPSEKGGWEHDHSRVVLEARAGDQRQDLIASVHEMLDPLLAGNVERAIRPLQFAPDLVWPGTAADYEQVHAAWKKVLQAKEPLLGGKPGWQKASIALLQEALKALDDQSAQTLEARAHRYITFRIFDAQTAWTLQKLEPRTVMGKPAFLATVVERSRGGGWEPDLDQFLLLEDGEPGLLVLAFWDVRGKEELVDSVVASLRIETGRAPQVARKPQRTEREVPLLGRLSQEVKMGLLMLACMSLPAAFGAAIGHSGVRMPGRASHGAAASGAFFTTGIATALGSMILAAYMFAEMVSHNSSYNKGNLLAIIVMGVAVLLGGVMIAGVTAGAAFGAALGAELGARGGRLTAMLGAAVGAPLGPWVLKQALQLVSYLT